MARAVQQRAGTRCQYCLMHQSLQEQLFTLSTSFRVRRASVSELQSSQSRSTRSGRSCHPRICDVISPAAASLVRPFSVPRLRDSRPHSCGKSYCCGSGSQSSKASAYSCGGGKVRPLSFRDAIDSWRALRAIFSSQVQEPFLYCKAINLS
jgi:hypothetical protein